jgi:hypothetical protein
MRRQAKLSLIIVAGALITAVAIDVAVWQLSTHRQPPTAEPQPTSNQVSTTSATSVPTPKITTEDLERAPVPSLCGHPPGDLVDGSLPGIPENQGFVALHAKLSDSTDGVVFGDLTGDDSIDAAVVFDCSQGGVNWPQQIVLYAPGPTILGAVDLGAVAQFEHDDIQHMVITSGDVLVEWESYEGAGFCVKNWSAKLHWAKSEVDISDVTELPAQPDTATTVEQC